MKRILPVYPWPMHAKIAEALEAFDVTPVEALPGGPGPVLAIRKSPPFICDAIVVMDPERLADGVHIATSDGVLMVSMRQAVEKSLDMNGVAEYTETTVSRVRFE